MSGSVVGKILRVVVFFTLASSIKLYATDNIYNSFDREVFEFGFAKGTSDFSTEFKRNQKTLQSLSIFVKKYEAEIRARRLFVIIYAYTNSYDDVQSNFKTAIDRGNNLKEALIKAFDLTEDNFIIINRPHSYVFSKDIARVMIGKRKSVLNPRMDRKLNPETYELEYIPLFQPPNKERVSLRFNLLHWLAAAPNLGVEWKPYRNLGIMINGTFNMYENEKNLTRYKLYIVNPEIRYYWNEKNTAYFGAGGHYAVYNIKLSENGMQGYLYGGGITGGYKVKLRPKLDLDFTLGVGYSMIDYTPYNLDDGIGVMNSETRVINYFGITQLGVTLVWKIF